MQLIVSDNGRNVLLDPLSDCQPCVTRNCAYTRDGCDLWEIASAQTCPTGSSNDVVCGVLIDVCCLLAACLDNFKDGIDLEPAVRVLYDTFPIDDGFGEMSWIDTATEEFGGIIVKILGGVDCEKISMLIA